MWRALLVLGLLFVSPFARAEEEVELPRHRIVMENLTAVRYNPLGLQEYFTVLYRYRLMDSDSVLFSDTYVGIGPMIVLSPSFGKGGVMLRIVPIALVELEAIYRYQYFFGTFEQIIPADGTDYDWSDTAREENTEDTIATGGHQVVLQWRVQAAYGPVAVRNTSRYVYNDVDLPAGAIGYYDQTPDMLVPNKGWDWVNDLDVIGLFDKLKVGARWTYTQPWFGNGLKDEGNQSHRVGVLATYTFFEHTGKAFSEPTVILLAQWHLQHPYRAGQDVSAAIPYIGLAFTFHGDLLPFE